MKVTCPIIFKFWGKKVGHRLPPGKYSATILKSRINKAGNLEFTFGDVKPSPKDDTKPDNKEVL